MKEVWKDITGFYGYYQVSNLGNLKSLSRKVKHSSGSLKILKEKISIGALDGKGYLIATLSKTNTSTRELMHRLVAKEFLSNDSNLPQVNHKDGIKTNNNVTNLEWCTASYNVQHSFDNKLQIATCGENNHNSKFTQKEVDFIRHISKKHNLTQEFLAEVTGVSSTTIHHILRGGRYND